MDTLAIPLLVVATIAVIVFLVIAFTKRRGESSDERLKDDYVYRKEPSADQVAEKPNELSDNEITKG